MIDEAMFDALSAAEEAFSEAPERALVMADVAVEAVSSAFDVRPERSALLARFVSVFITDVLFVSFTRLPDPLMSPFAKSL